MNPFKRVIERQANRMQNRYNPTSSINRILDSMTDRIIENVIVQAKNTLGRERFWYCGNKDDQKDNEIMGYLVNTFLKKYDKNFEKHTVASNTAIDDSRYLTNTEFIIPVRFDSDTEKKIPDTFIYVAAGNRIRTSSGGSNDYVSEKMLRSSSPYNIYMYFFGKHSPKLVKEVEDMSKKFYRRKTIGLFNIDCQSSRGSDDESMNVSWSEIGPRSLDTLFFSHNEKEQIIDHINRFNQQETFYKDHQILYKTGIILYGAPGTGKTTLVKGIATMYDRDIVSVNVAHLKNIDLESLRKSIDVDTTARYIILLEDIDTLFLNRTSVESNGNESVDNQKREDMSIVNKLLQFLDGTNSPNNVIFIATTNHMERLDAALTRHGRFDVHINVDEIREKDVYRFGHSFGVTDEQIADILKEYYAETVGEGEDVKPRREKRYDAEGNLLYNQSAIQGFLLTKIENKEHSTEIVDSSEEIAKKVEEEKAEDDNDHRSGYSYGF